MKIDKDILIGGFLVMIAVMIYALADKTIEYNHTEELKRLSVAESTSQCINGTQYQLYMGAK